MQRLLFVKDISLVMHLPVTKPNRRNALNHCQRMSTCESGSSSVSGSPVLKGDFVELNFITDPAISANDVTVEMSRCELERLHRRP